ncbi:TonB family protein [Carboxylicivirga sp. N1Y90]|uniref:TonB family protein n=1 Tax=Carboxylicivirga fragile TaxID=3417571 RepID=UPI003D342411|nr:TonB family protein [Marinilabiliaceae bacterium N1Y90]
MNKILILFIICLLIPLALVAKDKPTGYHFKFKKGKYYLLNPKGKKVDCEPFTFAGDFSEGMAVVEKDLKFGYIDSTGQEVINFQFYDAGPFINGIAYAAKNKGEYGYIDTSGKFIIGGKYNYAQNFDGQFAKIQIGNLDTNQFGKGKNIFGLIDRKGMLLGNRYFSNISIPDKFGVFNGSTKDSVFTIQPSGVINFQRLVEKNNENESSSKLNSMPAFPGGEKGLRKYIAMNVRYPQTAYNLKMQGRVFISFTVDKDGNIKDVRPAMLKAPIMMQEGIRVVSDMPQWKPGYQDGKTVKVQYTIPINFVLQ